MKKLAIIGILVAGLAAAPAALAVNRPQLQEPIFQKGKNVTTRGAQVFKGTVTVWYRDPATGRITPIPYGKWRTEDGR
jgi:hypothetical protein